MDIIRATGSRKQTIARLYMKPGNGRIIVNNKDYKEYFPYTTYHAIIEELLEITGTTGQYDVKATVLGGGMTGQAEAVRHALAQALVQANAKFKPPLKEKGYLTRDARMVERKKAGKKKARKSHQYRKR